MPDAPPSRLLSALDNSLHRRELASNRRRLSLAADGAVDFSSNDFLSLSESEQLRRDYVAELERCAHVRLGSTGSRLLDGNSAYTEQLERRLAAFFDGPSALLFNSGYDANSALFSCIPQPGDAVVYDEYIHASVHEGMRLSRAKHTVPFIHNSISDFARVVSHIIVQDRGFASGDRNVFVALETVYSMDGDLAPLAEFLKVMDRLLPQGNGHLIIDEAHATGVYGPSGRGIVYAENIQGRILARLHTFGKALTTNGVLCHPIMREYMINYARSFIYTTAMGLPNLAMIKTVTDFMEGGHSTEAQQRLWELVSHTQARLDALEKTWLLSVPKGPPKSPIFALLTPRPKGLARYCQMHGLVVRAIVPPTVPEGLRRVRVCLHSRNTHAQIDQLVAHISEWLALEKAEATLAATSDAPGRAVSLERGAEASPLQAGKWQANDSRPWRL